MVLSVVFFTTIEMHRKKATREATYTRYEMSSVIKSSKSLLFWVPKRPKKVLCSLQNKGQQLQFLSNGKKYVNNRTIDNLRSYDVLNVYFFFLGRNLQEGEI